MKSNNLDKISSIIIILSAIYFILAEFISILNVNVSIINAYTAHTVSELGVPIGVIYNGVISSYSPMFILMNSAFIVSGLAIFIGTFFSLNKYIDKNKVVVDLFALIASIGVILVGMFYATDALLDLHIIGSVMIILGGNLLLVFVSKFVSLDNNYQKISKYLGIFGLISIVMLLIFRFSYLHDYQAIFERCAIYAIVLWSFITGVYCLKNSFKLND